MRAFKLLPVAVALSLMLVGCTSTNPKPAFDDVGRHVTARTGQEVRWMRDDAERDEIEKAVAALLQTNLTAESVVSIALLNNRTLQARQQFAQRLAIIVEVNESAADIAKRQHDAGNINDLELQNQQAVYAESRLDLAKAEAQVRADRERINRLLGLWGEQTRWQIASELPPVPGKELPLENLEAIAVGHRLDLAAARGEVLGVASALKLKKSFRYLPGATIGVDAEHDLDHSWIVGPTLAVEVPLFDQGQSGVAKLAAEYRRTQRHLEALAVNILTNTSINIKHKQKQPL